MLSFQELGEFTAKITELCRCIPVYGLADVKEVLQLISTTKAITVAEARPLKVLNYLQVKLHFCKGLFYKLHKKLSVMSINTRNRKCVVNINSMRQQPNSTSSNNFLCSSI